MVGDAAGLLVQQGCILAARKLVPREAHSRDLLCRGKHSGTNDLVAFHRPAHWCCTNDLYGAQLLQQDCNALWEEPLLTFVTLRRGRPASAMKGLPTMSISRKMVLPLLTGLVLMLLPLSPSQAFAKGPQGPDIFTIFTGPLLDQHGAERVSAGKSLTVEELLGMDWFVERVETAIP
jgi:hypothetical protein